MKSITLKRRFHAAVLVVGALFAVAAPAMAEGPSKAKVPFDFKVGDTLLTAGDYTVGRVSINSQELLVLRDNSGKPVAIINGIRAERQSDSREPRLVFTKYAQGTVLSEIWLNATESGVSVPKSRFERELLLGSGASKESVAMMSGK
jgi:hypothetical protein